jgi:hypothetical protein
MPNWEEWSFVAEEEQEAIIAGTKGAEDEAAANQKGDAPPPTLPPQLGQEATSLKELQLRYVHSLKVVENLSLLSEVLLLHGCKGLERLSNLPQVRVLRVSHCSNLRCVEELGSLEQLWLDIDMRDVSSQWVPGLQHGRQQCHGEDLDVYTWPRTD